MTNLQIQIKHSDIKILTDNMHRWLLKNYKCVIADPASSVYLRRDEKENVIYLASELIPVRYDFNVTIPKDTIQKRAIEKALVQGLAELVRTFKKEIARELYKHGFRKGDIVYVDEMPTFYIEDRMLRDRKILIFGYARLYYKEYKGC